MKKRVSFWFTCFLVVLIVVLSVLASQITGRIVISQNSQRLYMADTFRSALEQNAISRLKSLDPQAQWLNIEENTPQEVEDYITETLTAQIRLNGDQLSKDSNLAWVIHMRVDGTDHEYTHNWKDSYDLETGALDYTIRKTNGKISYQGTIYPSQSFDALQTILVNPTIVPSKRLSSQKGSEYTYSYTLPNDFSIRYYIPSTIKANGGMIARACENMDSRNFFFALLAGSGIIALIVIVVKWKYEKDSFMLTHLRNTKALFSWLIMSVTIYGMSTILYALCVYKASGTLKQLLQSFGLSMMQADFVAFSSVLFMWFLVYSLITLALLYIKSIFTEGITRYFREDTLVSSLLKNSRIHLAEVMSSSHNNNGIFQIFVISSILMVIICALMAALGIVFNSVGLILGFIFGTIVVDSFLWSVYQMMNHSYQKVYKASEKLASGKFTELEKEDIGLYQPLYDLLVETSNSCQEAVKEGLASQISKTQLISNVSHDLKTPVAGIQSYAELISLSDDMEDIHEYAKRLNGYSMRLTDLITDLFDVARATSGDIVLEPMDIDLAELVMQVAAEWTDQFETKSLKLIMNLRPNTILHLDPGKTVRIIENLFSNIQKYSLHDTRVFVDLYEKDGLYNLTFKNISSTEMNFTPESIVERFTRGDASRHEKGSGLGLAIVKSFVEIQNGTFVVQTDGDLFKASITFEVPKIPELPIADDEKFEKEVAQPSPAQPAASAPSVPGPKAPAVTEEPVLKAATVTPPSIPTPPLPVLKDETDEEKTTDVLSDGNASDDSFPIPVNEDITVVPLPEDDFESPASAADVEMIVTENESPAANPAFEVDASADAIRELHQRRLQQQREYLTETDILRKASLKSSITELERMEKEALAKASQLLADDTANAIHPAKPDEKMEEEDLIELVRTSAQAPHDKAKPEEHKQDVSDPEENPENPDELNEH